jgi:hypothetical protein
METRINLALSSILHQKINHIITSMTTSEMASLRRHDNNRDRAFKIQ